MCKRLFLAIILILYSFSYSLGDAAFAFVDGLWRGGVGFSAETKSLAECWARTTFGDGTTLTLTKRREGIWRFSLSNPAWKLPPFQRYDMVTMVDFYPQLRVVAKANGANVLEIDDIEQISLLQLIENGHTITFTSNGFSAKYDLEGSAKIIARLRSCLLLG
jgi:hypothetical protein